MIQFSTVVAVDPEHVPELRIVWPTWKRFRPELLTRPLKILADRRLLSGRAFPDDLDFIGADHSDVEIVEVPETLGDTQRAKMLAAMTLLAPFVVETPWLLKLDADCYAKRIEPRWCGDELIAPGGKQFAAPVFSASPWGYTKPNNAIAILDDWADSVPELKCHARLNLPYDPNGKIVPTPGRMVSWVFFGRVDWLRWAAGLCGKGRIPFPSHDTYLSYLALRTKEFWRPVRHRRLGWENRTGIGRLRAEVDQVLSA